MRSSKPLERKLLHDFMKKKGFKLLDDFYYMDRTDNVEKWQSTSIFDLVVFLDGKSVYDVADDIEDLETTGHWDCLEASYLLATLPKIYIKVFCNKIFELATEFTLKVYYQNEVMDRDRLFSVFSSYAEELSDNYSEPGSNYMSIFIENTYPR